MRDALAVVIGQKSQRLVEPAGLLADAQHPAIERSEVSAPLVGVGQCLATHDRAVETGEQRFCLYIPLSLDQQRERVAEIESGAEQRVQLGEYGLLAGVFERMASVLG